uniref:Putative secreted protein n=1 Tax=Amblyomma tuberculatum TaxID=48802 RepID=A0A6M2E0S0_9ACAR
MMVVSFFYDKLLKLSLSCLLIIILSHMQGSTWCTASKGCLMRRPLLKVNGCLITGLAKGRHFYICICIFLWH